MKSPPLHATEMVSWRSPDHFIERVRVEGGWLYHAVYFGRLDAATWGGTTMCFVPDSPRVAELADEQNPNRRVEFHGP